MIIRRHEVEKVFLEELMENILKSTKIPKVQVERIIGSILSVFIADIVTEKFKNIKKYRGKYKLVLQEFPLKKGNNLQSTNIDYILYNKEKRIVVFLELKTDSDSFEPEQLRIYSKYKTMTHEDRKKLFDENILDIRKKSNKKKKYDFILQRLRNFKGLSNDDNKLIIVYLAPEKARNKLRKEMDDLKERRIDRFLSFNLLPDLIEHKYYNEWKVIKKYLSKLDKN